MTPTKSPDAAVIDANVLIGICAKETEKASVAVAILDDYAAQGTVFYAPGVIISEVLFVLCNKFQNGVLTELEYHRAIKYLKAYMGMIYPPPLGDVALIPRAQEIQSGYSCRHSTDSIYAALAEELTKTNEAELITFDQGLEKQAAKNAPTVKVRLLLPTYIN
jgi:predicted nucleic acid-binding protein